MRSLLYLHAEAVRKLGLSNMAPGTMTTGLFRIIKHSTPRLLPRRGSLEDICALALYDLQLEVKGKSCRLLGENDEDLHVELVSEATSRFLGMIAARYGSAALEDSIELPE